MLKTIKENLDLCALVIVVGFFVYLLGYAVVYSDKLDAQRHAQVDMFHCGEPVKILTSHQLGYVIYLDYIGTQIDVRLPDARVIHCSPWELSKDSSRRDAQEIERK